MTDFKVGLSRDLRASDGSSKVGDLGLSVLDRAQGVEWGWLPADVAEFSPEHLRDIDALLLSRSYLTASSLEGIERLAIVARLGVGYDRVDVGACTDAGVLLTIAPEAVRRPVAASTMAFILALAHKLPLKDRLIRAGQWEAGREHVGMGLTGRVLGLIGAGNVGREVLRLAEPFELRPIVHDPFVSAESLGSGVRLVSLDEVLATADFVVVACPLNEATKGLLDSRRLGLLKPSAYLINVARGPIVDQKALTAALRERKIAGAALDVFEREPIAADDPLLQLDNVILTPHAVAVTDEWAAMAGTVASYAVLEVAAGRIPENVVNPEVVENPRLQEKLKRSENRAEGK